MPTPKPSEETRDEWMERCIPVLISEGNEQNQAVAICSSMWTDYKVDLFQGIILKK
jgi:hypothetical protein